MVSSNVNGSKFKVVYHKIYGKPIFILNNKRKTKYTYYKTSQIKSKLSKNKESYFVVPIRVIIISCNVLIPFALRSIAASIIALACISVISG